MIFFLIKILRFNPDEIPRNNILDSDVLYFKNAKIISFLDGDDSWISGYRYGSMCPKRSE